MFLTPRHSQSLDLSCSMLSIKQGIVTARRKRPTLMTFLRRRLYFDRGFGSTVVETNNSSLLFPHWQRRSCPILDSTLKLWPVDDPNTGSPTSYALMKVCVKCIVIVGPSRFDFDSTIVVSVRNTHKEYVKTASDSRRPRTAFLYAHLLCTGKYSPRHFESVAFHWVQSRTPAVMS